MTDLNVLPFDAYSFANGINDLGQIVGVSYTAGFASSRAFIYENGRMTDLNDSDPFTFWGAAIAWSLAYVFFFSAFAMRQERFPSPFLWLGRISYSLYLVHPLIVVLVVHWTLRPVAFLVGVVASLALADTTYRYVELPFQELGRRVQRRLDAKPAPVST